MINDIDKDILNIIQQDARISNAEIARQVGLAPSAVLERVKKLEERKIIRGYATELDAAQLDFGLTAFVAVRTNQCGGETDVFLSAIPEVRVKNTEELAVVLRERLKNVPNVISTKTTIVLQTIKETIALPLEKSRNAEKLFEMKGRRREKNK